MLLYNNSQFTLPNMTTTNIPLDALKFANASTNWSEDATNKEMSDECVSLEKMYQYWNDLYWNNINYKLVLSLYGIVCTVGTIANLLVITSFARVPSLRNLRNYFIVNLAVSDLLLCTTTAPGTLYLTLYLFWPFGKTACQIVASIQAANLFVSCLTLVLIAMDRFLLTLCPVKWKLAAKAPIICYLVVWLASTTIAAPYFFAVSAEDVTFDPWSRPEIESMLKYCDRSKPQICIEQAWDRLPFSRSTYTLTVLIIQYILPLAALSFAYIQIGSTIRKRVMYNTTVDGNRRRVMSRRNRNAMLLLLSLVIVYGIAWLPMNAYNVLNVFEVISFSQHRYIYCHLIGMFSTCLNPILYALINESFRNAFVSIISPFLSPCTKYVIIRPRPQPMNQPTGTLYTSTIQDGVHKKALIENGKEIRLIEYNKMNGHIYDPPSPTLTNSSSDLVTSNIFTGKPVSQCHRIDEDENESTYSENSTRL